MSEYSTLENLASYMERRAAFHMRNGDQDAWGACERAAKACHREIERRKDLAALAN